MSAIADTAGSQSSGYHIATGDTLRLDRRQADLRRLIALRLRPRELDEDVLQISLARGHVFDGQSLLLQDSENLAGA